VPHPLHGAETDSQKPPLRQDDVLPLDVPAAPKNSSALLPSSTLALNGINIAAAIVTLHDAAPNATVPGSPASAPAALVSISGIAVEIASKALAGKNRFEIRLDPPELGGIHVRLDVDHSGEISSHLVADRSDTLDLLRRDAPSLERALQDAGLKTSNNGLQFSLRDHGFTRQEPPFPLPTNTRVIVNDEALPAETTLLPYRSLNGLRSGLDIRV
jgi:flagellar hook-length control protein FliK